MQRLFVTILAIFYMGTSTGATIHVAAETADIILVNSEPQDVVQMIN